MIYSPTLILHICAAAIGLVTGGVALFSRKAACFIASTATSSSCR